MKLFIGLVFLFSANLSFAECSRPAAPVLPDGTTADLEAMVEGQKAVKTYVADTEAYLECLNKEGEAMAEEESPEQQIARIEQHNSVVDEMESVANQFNEEIREYKAQGQ